MTLAARIRPVRTLAGFARPSLEELAGSAGEAAGLSVRDGEMTHYVDQVGSPNPVSVRDWTGSRIPLHAVSSGQVLLAHAPTTFVQRYLGRPMEPFTARTLVTADALLERMRAIRRDGYTWALEEFDEGISSVAAPVADASGEVVAAVHLHGPSYRFPAAGEERAARGDGRRLRGADLGEPAPGGLSAASGSSAARYDSQSHLAAIEPDNGPCRRWPTLGSRSGERASMAARPDLDDVRQRMRTASHIAAT